MKKMLVINAIAFGLTAFALQWLDYRMAIRALPVQGYGTVLALAFTALGLWVGYNLHWSPKDTSPMVNTDAMQALGVSSREYEVLTLLAAGLATKEIARHLKLSPNTVKTHLNRLYKKLSVQRRTQAIQKARALAIIA